MDKGTIFIPYLWDTIIEEFSEKTGCSISEFQEIELKNFMYEWTLAVFKENEEEDAING